MYCETELMVPRCLLMSVVSLEEWFECCVNLPSRSLSTS